MAGPRAPVLGTSISAAPRRSLRADYHDKTRFPLGLRWRDGRRNVCRLTSACHKYIICDNLDGPSECLLACWTRSLRGKGVNKMGQKSNSRLPRQLTDTEMLEVAQLVMDGRTKHAFWNLVILCQDQGKSPDQLSASDLADVLQETDPAILVKTDLPLWKK